MAKICGAASFAAAVLFGAAAFSVWAALAAGGLAGALCAGAVKRAERLRHGAGL